MIQWTELELTEMVSAGGATLELQPDKSVLVSGVNPAKDTYTLTCLTDLVGITAFRIEALPHPSLASEGPGRSNSGNFALSGVSCEASTKGGSRLRTIGLQNASASFSQKNWTVTGAIDGLEKTGWSIQPMKGKRSTAVFETATKIRYSGGARITLELSFQALNQHTIGRFRVSATTDAQPVRAQRNNEAWREMQGKINHALAFGVEYLLSNQELDGSWSVRPKDYRNGMTGLAVYALLKNKVRPSHPAVVRGVEFMRSEMPRKTYSMACQLLAISALGDPENDEWIEEMAAELIDWQRDGGFSYPDGGIDLSNTQYAALGLRAAAMNGVKIPPKVWETLVDCTILHQEQVERPEDPAGFGYHAGARASGGMTAAGVAILAICQEQLGIRATPRMAKAQERGLKWLSRHFSPSKEPLARGGAWLLYYLYGIERVGGITGLDYFGGLDWYRESVPFVVGIQKPNGAWATASAGETPANTAFAMLFLSRATASTSGPTGTAMVDLYGEDDPEQDVSLRASGDTPLTVWVSSFGEDLLHKYSWDNEESHGLRVKKVDYVTPGRILLTDGRTDTPAWKYSMRDPTGDWFAEDFPDRTWKESAGAFGAPGNRNAVVRTVWESERIYLRRWFELDTKNLVEPVLYLNYSRADGSSAPLAPLVCLFDEDEGFPLLLKGKTGPSKIEHSLGGASNGASCLRVTPQQVHALAIPDWSFRVTQKPEAGEYRFIRFAWRKEGGGGIMLQLANGGRLGDSAVRYFAGSNDVNYNPAIQIDKTSPKRWTIVTRDLYKDFGGEALITGMFLTPMNGEAGYFDEIYLARKRADLAGIPKAGLEAVWRADSSRTIEAAATFGGGVRIYLNGELLYEGGDPTPEYRAVETRLPLLELLREGRNLIAVACSGDGSTAVDIGIRDLDVIASKPGDPGRPSGGERYAIQHRFKRPGKYEVTARVHFVPPANADSGIPITVTSEPLSVEVNEAIDEEILQYARDPQINLFANAHKKIRVSSELEGWPSKQAADNMQALAWLCADGDRSPWISIEIDRPIRANTILLSHARPSRSDPERTIRAQRVEVRFNGGGTPYVVEMRPDDLQKTEFRLKRTMRVRKIELRIIASTPGHATKTAVGFSEIELQMRK